MTLTLTVRATEWNRRVDRLAGEVDHLVPVIKGNGYGFGRDWLAERAAGLSSVLAVGSVHEVSSVPAGTVPVVLTPTLDPPADLRADTVLTIGGDDHLAVVARQPGRAVLVKVRSSMNRFGVEPRDAVRIAREAERLGLDVRGFSIHPPRAGSSADHAAEIERLVGGLDTHSSVWVSHVEPDDVTRLRERHPSRDWFVRMGTELWHGDKSLLHLHTDVLDTHPVRTGDVAGYRSTPIELDGTVVIVGCGSAHGVAPLPGESSPFHHARHRMPLIEPPHMHTSMCLVAAGDPVPAVGDTVDVQRPLITTVADVIRWV